MEAAPNAAAREKGKPARQRKPEQQYYVYWPDEEARESFIAITTW